MKRFKLNTLAIFSILIINHFNCEAQSTIIWQKIIPDMPLFDFDYQAFIKTSDGGFILVTDPSDSNDIINESDSEAYRIVKFSAIGDIEWQSEFYGTDDDDVISINETSDNGYIIGAIIDAGDKVKDKKNKKNQKKGGVGEEDDYWIIKTDDRGKIQWQNYFGGEDDDELAGVFQTNDGGYLIYGESDSYKKNVLGSHGGGDFWVIKTNTNGNMEWQKCYGGSKFDEPDFVFQSSDNNFYFAGETQSSNGQIKNHIGLKDVWVFKTDVKGNLLWEKCLGSIYNDELKAFSQTLDGGLVVAGESWDSKKGEHKNSDSINNWLTKLSSSGMVEWTIILDTNRNNFIISTLPIGDEGVLIAGYTQYRFIDKKNYLDTTENKYWIVNMDKNGIEHFRKDLGTFTNANAYSFLITKDKKYLLAGKITSTFESGLFKRNNLWMIKLDPDK